jgi:NADPH:quinone reductase-like Zn-dependent oxidoreductase
MQREGRYNVPPQAGPTLGVEFAGHIEQLGGGATGDFKVGDEVFGLAYGGCASFQCFHSQLCGSYKIFLRSI